MKDNKTYPKIFNHAPRSFSNSEQQNDIDVRHIVEQAENNSKAVLPICYAQENWLTIEGASSKNVEMFSCHKEITLRDWGGLCGVSRNLRYRKIFCVMGVSRLLLGFFGLKEPKKIVGGSFGVSESSGLCKRGHQNFSLKFFCRIVPKNFVESTFWCLLVFPVLGFVFTCTLWNEMPGKNFGKFEEKNEKKNEVTQESAFFVEVKVLTKKGATRKWIFCQNFYKAMPLKTTNIGVKEFADAVLVKEFELEPNFFR